jgi:hypothetical protein
MKDKLFIDAVSTAVAQDLKKELSSPDSRYVLISAFVKRRLGKTSKATFRITSIMAQIGVKLNVSLERYFYNATPN